MDSIIIFFKGAFTVVLALALSEAFKQFVTDRISAEGRYQEPRPDQAIILWPRLPALLSFLFLIWPFFHGMNAYFSMTYLDHSHPMPSPYSFYLSADGVLFTIEAALFFVMSRALSLTKWRLFYCCIIVLLMVDSVWGFITLTHTTRVRPWLILNAISFLILGIIILALHKISKGKEIAKSKVRYFICVVLPLLSLTRTSIDYWKMWDLYFPDH
jgi:hypothetical protein